MFDFRSPVTDFIGPASFLFFNATGAETLSVLTTMPAPSALKKKCLICLKARDSTEEPGFECIEKEIIYMEVNRPVLENLYQTCNVSTPDDPSPAPHRDISKQGVPMCMNFKFKFWEFREGSFCSPDLIKQVNLN